MSQEKRIFAKIDYGLQRRIWLKTHYKLSVQITR